MLSEAFYMYHLGYLRPLLRERAMRQSDTKTEFDTGAHRDSDEGKGRPSLISPVLIHRLGVHLAKGAEHYGEDNWSKGMPYRRTYDSMLRHMGQWLAGDREEDHLAAIAFGVMCLMTFEEEVIPEMEGRNPLDDRDRRLVNILPSIVKPDCNMDDRDANLKKILPSLLTSAKPDDTLKVASGHKRYRDFMQSVYGLKLCVRCGWMNTEQKDGVCLVCKEQEEQPDGPA